jgi:hypothetical protein
LRYSFPNIYNWKLSAYSIDKNFESVLHYYTGIMVFFVRFIVLDLSIFLTSMGKTFGKWAMFLLTVLVHAPALNMHLVFCSNLYFLFEASKITVNGPKSEIYWFSFFPSLFCM